MCGTCLEAIGFGNVVVGSMTEELTSKKAQPNKTIWEKTHSPPGCLHVLLDPALVVEDFGAWICTCAKSKSKVVFSVDGKSPTAWTAPPTFEYALIITFIEFQAVRCCVG